MEGGPLRLVVFCGLPGAGKSAAAGALARATGWPVLGVDPAEAALVRAGIEQHRQPTGLAAYTVVEALAEAQLRAGITVIVDAVNDVAEARGQWIRLADRTGAALEWFEVVCSDPTVHRMRLQQRRREEDPLIGAPTWESLNRRRRQLALWKDGRVVLDSRHASPDELAARALRALTTAAPSL
ncbi:AAA family ATPase [Zafaria sp. Z1313]|uniref:AAA family ATPase n=1 Tax=unclassified Zafaria TaxID=2828765 RepID=UPI002E78CD5B|nr:AAA family ATPase [Zafaria sp. J156]MEE1622120.1 AAA family ATPase [Zafaria sp. J156]